jgi:phthiocerol/phenolphthiocerol synthesis type-I polyketide synthase E
MSDLFEPIAVVGMAGRLPGARNLREYWRNLAEGRESITALTDEVLLAAGVPPSRLADPAYVKMAGLVPGVDMFDAEFFRMAPREAEVCDPQLRLFLEVTHEAVEDAGYSPAGLGRDVAVYGACGPNHYGDLHVLANPTYAAAPDMGLVVLNSIDYLATLTSYKMDFRGPSMSVLTACSSSLSAVQLACRSLQFAECDAAVAGASNVDIPYRVGYRWSPGDVRSPDGHCRPFDAAATGTIFTSGAGAVLLKRMSDAIADGDHIWAVIHGIGINNDGSEKVSFAAPSVAGQGTAILDAMAVAGFSPQDIGYVEMHATGTPLGDPIEMSALAGAYGRLAGDALAAGTIPVGSVKANIGHTNSAAGIAGLLKLALALENEHIPATINVGSVNPRLEIKNTPFFVNDTLRPWPRTAGRPRRAALSSLGIGGTNVHLVVEEGPVPLLTPHRQRPRVVVWSGRDEAAMNANRTALAEYFTEAGEGMFADAAATLQHGRTAHQVRGAVVCTSAEEAARSLGQAEQPLAGSTAAGESPDVVFAFPGQGSQHARMAAGLYGRQRVFTETADVCLDGFIQQGIDLYPLWLAENPGDDLHETENAQPLLFMIEYALAQQWIEWGIRPAALVGHSVGELVAATVAGVMQLDDALRLVAMRGQIMQRQPRGGMLVAATAAGRLSSLLPGGGSGVAVAAVNAHDQVVLAGAAGELAAAAEALAGAGVAVRPLRTSHAFHTPAMRSAAEEFLAGFDGVQLRAPALPVYSAATGQRLTTHHAGDPAFWAQQLAGPVLFAEAVNAAAADGRDRIMLEVGPGRALVRLAQRHPAVQAARWRAFASLPAPDDGSSKPQSDERNLLETLAELWVHGCAVNWSMIYRDEPLQRVSLPGYQFQRGRFWVQPVTGPAAPRSAVEAQPTAAPAPNSAVEAKPTAAPAACSSSRDADEAGPFTVLRWTEAARPALPARGLPTYPVALALIPADSAGAVPFVSALLQAGYRVVRLRPGDEFKERGGEFVVRPAHLADDLDQVLSRLDAAGHLPSLLVHAWGTGVCADTSGSIMDELDRTLFALLDLVQRAGRRPARGRLPSLLVLTTSAIDVSGDEAVVPARAALIAATRSVGLESPGTACRVIDVGVTSTEDQLAAELRSGATDPLVALRGARRWLPVQRPWPVPPGGQAAIRPGGVYVVTGGLGGLGLAVAKSLAATGRRPKLVLLARTRREAIEDLAEIESMGANVRVIICDVADRSQLDSALHEAEKAFGPVNGVLHLAGVAGGGMTQFRSREDVESVLRPKVLGTVFLAETLDDRPPVDFVVCFSSQAALTGMVGGADYAAANAFLDAYAAGRPRWLSINWPGWTTVGMAAGGVLEDLAAAMRAVRSPDARPAPEPGLCHETVLSAATHWVLDEHRVGNAAVLPGAGIVDVIIRAYLDTIPGAGAPVTLRDVVFVRPLIAERARRTRVCFEPAGAGAWRVQVLSRPDGTAGSEPDGWRQHASCLLTTGGPPARRVIVDEVVAGLSDLPAPSLLPSRGSAFRFGPHWHTIKRMWGSASLIVIELALPPAFAAETREHAVHPALLDTGTAAARHGAAHDLLLPFLYQSMTWYAPLPDRLHSQVRLKPSEDLTADIDFIAPDGTVVVAIEGFRMRRATLNDLGAGADSGPADSGTEPGEARAAAAPVDGLPPEEGVRLLLRLLESPMPAQIAVVPHQDGRPVPSPGSVPSDPPRAEHADATEVAVGRAAAVPPARAADGSLQDRLATIWQQVLGRQGIGPQDDFFALGGDSLMAVALTGRIRDAFGVEMSIGSLFDYPNLAALTTALREQGAQ